MEVFPPNLAVIFDIYPTIQAWNLRRHIINEVITRAAAAGGGADSNGSNQEGSTRDPSSLDTLGEPVPLLRSELEILQATISKNAKVYCLWHHRLWAIDKMIGLGEKGTCYTCTCTYKAYTEKKETC